MSSGGAIIAALLLQLLIAWSAKAWTTPIAQSTTALAMSSRFRGLDVQQESATPTEGGMVLFLKAGPDGKSVGDCPFAQYIRLVLEEKGLEYDLRPSTQETKPTWLVEHYEGKLPALRHRKECYVESDVIVDYLDFFFPKVTLKPRKSDSSVAAEEAVDGFFPAVAKYLKDTSEDSAETLENLQAALKKVNDHLDSSGSEFLCGDSISLLDCSLAPKLYHLQTGIEGFKGGVPNLEQDYQSLAAYYQRMYDRPSFQATIYPKETILWGWENARK